MSHETSIPKIAVVMCTFARLSDLLSKTLDMLKNQTDLYFDLFIWNNNQEIKDLSGFCKQEEYPFRISYYNSPTNVGGIGRFYQAQRILHLYEYVIFIDDDQHFDKYMIETLRKEARPGLISGWWAYKILSNYNQRKRSDLYQEADYIGTGGMICPCEIFSRDKLFHDIPPQYIFIEDLWLSYFAKYECHYELRRSAVNMGFIPHEAYRNQHNHLKNKKVEFHNYLHQKYVKVSHRL